MVRFTRTDAILIVACHDGTISSWDPATGRPTGPTLVMRGHISVAALSADERFLGAGFAKGAIVLADRASGRELRRIQAYSAPVTDVAFAPDGRTLAAVAAMEQSLTLWEVPSLRE